MFSSGKDFGACKKPKLNSLHTVVIKTECSCVGIKNKDIL